MRETALIGERFELLGIAGAGGMGTVHRARDRETGETVAVKVLSSRGRAETERFAQEAALLSEMKHPSIVRYIAHGASEAGAFLAMEWLEGEDLSDRLRRGALPLADALVVAERVASALAAAHARGVVHRDVKPSNVFLVGGLASEAKVLDFGVARIAGRAAMTRTGAVIGTPGYMAPEQARGSRDLDARVDVFALGCVLYECLTGEAAFRAESLLALLARILLDDPLPPSSIAPVPPDVDRLVMRMLAKDPASRPRDAAAVAEALTRLPPSASASIAPSAGTLGEQEQEWASLVFARDPSHVETAEARTLPVGERDTGERLAAAVSSLGARVERLLDGTLVARLAMTGTPRDRAVRAARCALATRRELGTEARVALVTGRGVRGARVPLGEVIDQAARLLSYPWSPEGPRVDGSSAGLLDARFSIGGDTASLTLRAELDDDEAPRRLLGQPSPCVGRDRELATLTGLFEECVSESVARVVLVSAPPGAGKSRLRKELGARLAGRPEIAMPWIARGDVMSAGSPHGMLVQLVRSAMGLRDGEPVEVSRRKLVARVEQRVARAEVDRIAAFLGELASVPFDDDETPALRGARADPVMLGDQILAAWEDFVAAELETGPRVLVLEDLHWGDRPTIRACDRVLRRLRDRPLFVLATARPEVHEAFPRLWDERDVQEIRLVPISPRASERLVRSALGANVADDVTARIVARAEGNAFVLEELIRAESMGASGALPETVLAIAAARLDALDVGARRILRAASVFGEVFWQGGAAALTSAPDLDAALARLVESEIVERRATTRFDGERELCFRHALLRDAAYASLTAADLATGHRLAAAWLESQGERDPVLLAEHHERGGDRVAAATFYARAAEHALEGNDFAAVVTHAERALAAGGGDAGAAACKSLIADAEQWRGNFAAASKAGEEAMALYPEGSAGWHRCLMIRVIAAQRSSDQAGVLLLAEQALVTNAADPDAHRIRVEVLARLAMRMQFYRGGPIVDALATAAEKSAPAEADGATLGWLEAAASARAHARNDLPVFLAHLERSSDHLLRAGYAREALSQMADQGWWWPFCGEHERAETVSRRVIAEAERMGLRGLELNARMGLVVGLLTAREVEKGRAEAQHLLDHTEGADHEQARLFAGWAAVAGERYEDALRELNACTLARGGLLWKAMRGYQIVAHVACGRLDEAAQLEADLTPTMSHRGLPHIDVAVWKSVAVFRHAAGNEAGAREAALTACERVRDFVTGMSDRAQREKTLDVAQFADAIAFAKQLGLTPTL